MTTIRTATFELLRKLNIQTIFGNPGSTEETFLQDFPTDFQYIQTLHESSAVGAADGYAQATKTVGLVNIHTSAGLSNAMSNILTASMNQTPLIITAGNQTREMLLLEPWLTNIQAEEVPKPFVKWSYEPKRAEDVPGAFMRAYAMAVQEPAGPVFLSIPLDDWDKPFHGELSQRDIGQRFGPDPERLLSFAKKLNEAQTPALILGADIARDEAWTEVVQLAEQLNIPVYAAPASERTPFPENHPLYVGGLPFAIKPLADKLKGHDVALIIGAPVFRYYPYLPGDYLPKGLELLHITNNPDLAAKAPVGNSLLSNAQLAMQQLIPFVKKHEPLQIIEKVPHNMAPHPVAVTTQDRGYLEAREVFATLREVMPQNTILVEETPSNLADLHAEWPITTLDSFYTFASGSLGWGLPASVGIALGERVKKSQRPILSVIGDGSLQYAIQGLWTASQHQLPIIYIVPINQEYGILKSFSIAQNTLHVPGLNIPDLDIVSLAKGYGCHGVEARSLSELTIHCQEAILRQQPTVIAVPINPSIPPLI
ncbi:benzoylformate decarboxylase [Vagococcus sp.]|uniref:benzoylformate decarboxylase n=1 Tax=Vagococcus sp. TaxID=1933889 RepID=UPI003F96843B